MDKRARCAMAVALAATWLMLGAGGVRAQEDEAAAAEEAEDAEEAEEAPIGLSVDGIVRSTRGGFAFPDGEVMSGPPSVALGGPFVCEPAPGETRSCPIGGEWHFCGLSSIAFARFNPFVEPSCTIVDRGNGQWSIDIVSSGQFVVRCVATCLRMTAR